MDFLPEIYGPDGQNMDFRPEIYSPYGPYIDVLIESMVRKVQKF